MTRLLHFTILGILLFSMLAGLASTPAAAAQVGFGDEAKEKLDELLRSGKVSPESQTCISCHLQVTPGIVYSWLRSKHAWVPISEVGRLYDLIGAPEWKEKIDLTKFQDRLDKVVGCYECHGRYKDDDRPDVYSHFGFNIVTVVTRKDCGQCHPKENAEISWTWHAMGSLHAPFLAWYKKLMSYIKEKFNADPFTGDKAAYEKYFPPYLTHKRGEPVYWNFYKEIAKAWRLFFEKGEENEVIKLLKEATGTVTPYDWDLKKWISPNWPASGVLNTTVLARLGIKIPVTAMGQKSAVISNVMEHPWFRNGYFYHACLECHGSIVIPYGYEEVDVKGYKNVGRMKLWGWPNNGAARVDPDGSHGTCTACHDRHQFSIKQAREPWTCGRCHLGYDHPHIEIYEESAHGNIWDAYGHEWNWNQLPWRVGVDFSAPTCATCHMSTIADAEGRILVKGTHDLVKRLVWDQMHFFGIPKHKIPDKIQQSLFYGWSQLKSKIEELKPNPNAPEEFRYPVFTGFKIVEGPEPGEPGLPRLLKVEFYGELKEHREEMKAVCNLCHSSQWTDNFFRTADQNIIDYDIVARFAQSLLKLAYEEGIHDPTNPIDEYMEIMWYYIWHHDGRRWRNGAFMMGPDYAHWYGIVDTVMDKLGRMISYLEVALKIKAVEEEIELLKKAAAGAPYIPELAAKIAELEKQLEQLRARLEALEAQVPALQSEIMGVEAGFEEFEARLSDVAGKVETVSSDVKTLMEELKKLSEQLAAVSPRAEELQKRVAELEQIVKALEDLKASAEKASEMASSAYAAAEAVGEKIEELSAKVEATTAVAYMLTAIAIAAAVVALVAVLLLYFRKK